MKKPRVLLHLAALAMGLCLLAGCAAQPAAPAQATIPHIETSPQPTVAPSPTPNTCNSVKYIVPSTIEPYTL